MNVVHSTAALVVIDDFIEPEGFRALSDYVCSRRFPGRISFIGHKVRYALHSGLHLTPAGAALSPALAREAARRRVLQRLPAGDPADRLTDGFAQVGGLIEATVGGRDDRWFGYTRDFYRAAAGAGLRWHCDTEVYSGAYVFYASSTWDADWGGELCVQPVAQPALRGLSREAKVAGLDGGAYYFPRPNRLVLIRGGTPHRVNAVASLAAVPRHTIGGFFLTEAGLRQRESELMRRYVAAPRIRRFAIDMGLRLYRR